MTFLLDTNVVSELTKPAPDAKCVAWLNDQAAFQTPFRESQRDSIHQSRSRGIARSELPWVECKKTPQPQRGCIAVAHLDLTLTGLIQYGYRFPG